MAKQDWRGEDAEAGRAVVVLRSERSLEVVSMARPEVVVKSS
jgi:hypothetical protein